MKRLGFLEVLTVVFVVLKVVGAVSWSWWIVFSPILIPMASILILLALGGLIEIHDSFVNKGD